MFSCFLHWLLALSGTAEGQVLDGSRNPHAFSDREALGILFTVVRSGAPGGWDFATRRKCLMELGLTRSEAFRLIEAADNWFREIHPLDVELREIRKAARNGEALLSMRAVMSPRCGGAVFLGGANPPQGMQLTREPSSGVVNPQWQDERTTTYVKFRTVPANRVSGQVWATGMIENSPGCQVKGTPLATECKVE